MEERRQHLNKLHAELRTTVRYADCERALAAFNKVLSTAGFDPWGAAHSEFKLESWDDTGFPEDGCLTPEVGRSAAAS